MILINAKDELLSAIGNDGSKIEAFEITYKGYYGDIEKDYYRHQKEMALDDMRNDNAHESITHHNLALFPEDRIDVIFYKNSNPTALANALELLDFCYNCDFGGQELFGTVWLKDGSWLERYEYDGSEIWEHKFKPKMPSLTINEYARLKNDKNKPLPF